MRVDLHAPAGAEARYPAGRLGRRDQVLFCTRERRPDAYGRWLPDEARCGAARLPVRAQATGSMKR